MLVQVSDQLTTETNASRDYTAANQLVRMLQEKASLKQETILSFLRDNKYEEVFAALSLLCGLPIDLIDRLLHDPRSDAILIPCKAANFEWATTQALLKSRPGVRQISPDELSVAWGEYLRLSKATAQRVVRFWQVRDSVKSVAPAQTVSAPPAA